MEDVEKLLMLKKDNVEEYINICLKYNYVMRIVDILKNHKFKITDSKRDQFINVISVAKFSHCF